LTLKSPSIGSRTSPGLPQDGLEIERKSPESPVIHTLKSPSADPKKIPATPLDGLEIERKSPESPVIHTLKSPSVDPKKTPATPLDGSETERKSPKIFQTVPAKVSKPVPVKVSEKVPEKSPESPGESAQCYAEGNLGKVICSALVVAAIALIIMERLKESGNNEAVSIFAPVLTFLEKFGGTKPDFELQEGDI